MQLYRLNTKKLCKFTIFLAVAFAAAFMLIPRAGSASGKRSPAVPMVPQSFTQLAKSASPSVVNIRTEKTVSMGGRMFQPFMGHRNMPNGNDPFQDFFGRFFNNGPQREFKQKSLGSGFILDQDGYIVTNDHVIKDADKIQVKLKDGKEYPAEIIGADPSTDLALIKIKADHLPALPLGDSDSLEVGEWVVAIGSPFGLEHTVTAGIVSAKGRVIGAGPYDDFIQTDASINPGNSGGPLLDMSGEVVGINTAIIAGGEGIGFAIPSNMAKNVIEQLKKSGEVTRGWLGVAIQDLDAGMKTYFKADHGVLVGDVFPGDPADKAGIKTNDIILSVNGNPVDSARDLSQRVSGLKVGDTATLKILRDGREQTVDVKISKRDESALADNQGQPGQSSSAFGVQVSDITPDIAGKYNVNPDQGVIVNSVEPDSQGDKAGIQQGDLVVEINHQAVKSVSDYRKIIGGIKDGDSAQMYIKRPNGGFMVITLTKNK